MFEFTVIGLTVQDDRGEVRLEGKFHKVFSSQLFLKLPVEDMGGYRIGDKFILAEPDLLFGKPPSAPRIVETVPLGTPRDRTDEWEGRLDASRQAVEEGFADGSPVPSDESEVQS